MTMVAASTDIKLVRKAALASVAIYVAGVGLLAYGLGLALPLGSLIMAPLVLLTWAATRENLWKWALLVLAHGILSFWWLFDSATWPPYQLGDRISALVVVAMLLTPIGVGFAMWAIARRRDNVSSE